MRGRLFFFPTLYVRKTGRCPRADWKAGWQFPDVTRPELKVCGRLFFFPTLYVRKTEKDKTGKGIGETGSGSATESSEYPYSKTFGERCALQGLPEGVVSPNAAISASLVTNVPCRPL